TLLAHYRYADRLLSLYDGTGTQYYHHDALGSTVNLSDDSGQVQVSYNLDPWGHIRNQTGTTLNRQIFTGQEHDLNTGLIYFGARYYDPDTARFITQDTYLGEPGTPPSLHRYLYAYSNPLVYVDLYGYAPVTSHVTEFFHGLSEGITEYGIKGIKNNEYNEKGTWKGLAGSVATAAMATGQLVTEAAAATAEMLDLAADAKLATSQFTKDTAVGQESRKRLIERKDALVKTGKQAIEVVKKTAEDPSAMADQAVESIKNYGQKTFIEGDPEYQADWTKKMVGVATAAAGAKAVKKRAKGSKTPEPDKPKDVKSEVLDEVDASKKPLSTTALTKYFPDDNGFLGETAETFLYKGQKIDRYGGGDWSRFFSPQGTADFARALPPGTAGQPLRTFEVMKPFPVQSGKVAPAFGQIGGGTQMVSPVKLKILLNKGILKEVTP
ncbi:MAG: glycohydrolase toxin TNT-related protein, partial [Planctomycetes bacterium]|nr:glycohydrolase toxin TNT-related protein [Planctomycetota bacterium]